LLSVPEVCKDVLSPVVLALFAAIHVNDDGIFAASVILTVPPEQIVAVFALVIVGVGFTVTVTVCGVPGHVPAELVGVTV
jgi:hypothetical protein